MKTRRTVIRASLLSGVAASTARFMPIFAPPPPPKHVTVDGNPVLHPDGRYVTAGNIKPGGNTLYHDGVNWVLREIKAG